MNDTHPALAIPELMRILVDEEGLEWSLVGKYTLKIRLLLTLTFRIGALDVKRPSHITFAL